MTYEYIIIFQIFYRNIFHSYLEFKFLKILDDNEVPIFCPN